MPSIKIDKDGNMVAGSYVKVKVDFACACGVTGDFGLDWPEGVTVTGGLNVTNLVCPGCKAPISYPRAKYYVEDGKLKSEPLPAPN